MTLPSTHGCDDLARRCNDFVAFLRSARPYLHHLRRPLSVAPFPGARSLGAAPRTNHGENVSTRQQLLDMVSTGLRIPPPVLRDEFPADSNALEHVVAGRLLSLLENVFAANGALTEVRRTVEELVHASSGKHESSEFRLTAADGVRLSATAAGPRAQEGAVILIGPCGLPTIVLQNWMDTLAEDRLVAACATRGFSADDIEFPDCSMSLEAQADDVLALMDHLKIGRAHVMSICGGAVVALRLALLAPERVGSLGLWHGDFNVENDRYTTRYQRDLRWLMTEGARSRDHAAELHPLVSGPDFVTRAREDHAHLVLFPYTTAELLYRYARANSAIMLTDVKRMARRITQPTWVVTSEFDDIAHPMGSRIVASLIPAAELIESDGDHVTCLDTRGDVPSIAARILQQAESA